MNTSGRVVETLEALGVEDAFGCPGGRVIEVFETLADSLQSSFYEEVGSLHE